MSAASDGGSGREAGRKRSGTDPVTRLFLLMLGLAGLGVGIWLFGRRRRQS